MNLQVAAGVAAAGIGLAGTIAFIAAQLLADRAWFRQLATGRAPSESPSLMSPGRSSVKQPAQRPRADRNGENEGIYLTGRTHEPQEGNR